LAPIFTEKGHLTLDKKNISSNQCPRTWNDVVASFEEELYRKRKAKGTISMYGAVMKSFGMFYREHLQKPGPYVSRLQETDLYAFVDHLRSTRRLSLSAINRTVSTLHAFSQFIVEMQWHRRNIAKELRTYRVGLPPEPKRLSSSEVRRIVTSVDLNGRNGFRDLAIVQVFLQCGLRLGELTRLSIGDVTIHRTSGKIKVNDEKNRTERVVPLNASARSALRRYLDRRGEVSANDALFVSERGKRISNKMVQYLIKKHFCIIGRPDLSVHDLRHHFATELYERTGKLTAVQQVLGHRSIATTARYTQCTEKEISEAVEKLPDNVYPEETT
jgi:integrase/recombinase XerC